MDEESAQAGRLLRQHPGGSGVDGKAEVWFFFSLIHSRVGAGIEDNRGLYPLDYVPD